MTNNVNAIILNVANCNLDTFNGETVTTINAEDFDTVYFEVDALEGYTICEICGEYVSEDETTYIEGYGVICRNCLENDFDTCEHCGTLHRLEKFQLVIDAEGNEVLACKDCAADIATTEEEVDALEGYTICDHCGEYVSEDETTYIKGYGVICRNCLENDFDTCEHCGTLHRLEKFQLVIDAEGNEVLACKDCAEILTASENDVEEVKGYTPCEYCGNYHDESEMFYVEDEGYFCRECFEKNFSICEHCGTLHRLEKFQLVIDAEGNEVLACKDCAEILTASENDVEEVKGYTPCEYCGNYHDESEMFYVEDEGYFCRECFEKNFSICEHCGDTFHNEDLRLAVDAEENLILVCRNCAETVRQVEGYTLCKCCGKYHHNSKMTFLKGVGGICKDCIEEFFATCGSDSTLIKG